MKKEDVILELVNVNKQYDESYAVENFNLLWYNNPVFILRRQRCILLVGQNGDLYERSINRANEKGCRAC